MSLIESSPHHKRKTGRPRGRPVGSTNPGVANRLERFQMQERYAELIDAHGHAFAEEVMTRKAEDGIGPDGRGYAYSFDERFEVWKEIHNRGYGRAPVQVTVDQTNVSASKVVYEVRWLPPDPNDHSRVIEPEP
jgi:hypothetical protein